MFRSISKSTLQRIPIEINGQTVSVPEGITVWSSMALSGETTTRLSPVTKQKRSAYCAMGVCFECLVQIDGQPNQQACLTLVREGMKIQKQIITENTNHVENGDDIVGGNTHDK